MSSKLAPISYGSSIVGFTSFAFTFFTFVRVFWETILTLWSAPKQMVGYLDQLRIEIHNERAYFKSALRRTKSRSRSVRRFHEDVTPLKNLFWMSHLLEPRRTLSATPRKAWARIMRL